MTMQFIPAKPAVAETIVKEVEPAQPAKFVLELSELQMKRLVVITGPLPVNYIMNFDDWHVVDAHFNGIGIKAPFRITEPFNDVEEIIDKYIGNSN